MAVLLGESLASRPYKDNCRAAGAASGRAFLHFWLVATFLLVAFTCFSAVSCWERIRSLKQTKEAIADLVGGPPCAEHRSLIPTLPSTGDIITIMFTL